MLAQGVEQAHYDATAQAGAFSDLFLGKNLPRRFKSSQQLSSMAD
jgi:hypothetical protein